MTAPDKRTFPDRISGRIVRALRGRKPLWRFLEEFCRATERSGGKSYLVGGFVRDLAEGCRGKDIDVMVAGMDFDSLGGILRSLHVKRLGIRRVIPVGRAFAVYKVRTDWAGEEVDVALARSERSTGPGHREFAVRTKDVDAREDAARRDFTINSLLFALRTERGRLTGEVLDFFGGLADLRRRCIRGVGKPEDRFREDPLRMLRAIRQKNERRGYAVEKETWAAIRRVAPELFGTIPGERIAGELLRSLSAGPGGTVEDLHKAGILQILFPEVSAAGKSPGRIMRRFEILEKSLGRPLPEILLLAGLLVDVAERECKARVREAARNASRGKITALPRGEEKRLFRLPRTESVVRRLHFPQVRSVVRMLEDLTRLENTRRMKNPNARIESIFGRWETPAQLLSLYEAANKAAGRKGIDFRPLLRIAARRPPLLSGQDLLRLGIPASPRLEAILDDVRENTLTAKIKNRREAISLALSISGAGKTAPARRRGPVRRAGKAGRPAENPPGTGQEE
jgi:poly(A) polymerase